MKALNNIWILSVVCLLVLTISCTKSKECTIDAHDIPQCVLDKTTGDKYNPIRTIKAICVDGEIHYWLNTDAAHVDGTEAIVNAQCDTVCSIGGWRPPPECNADYNSYDKWVLVWER